MLAACCTVDRRELRGRRAAVRRRDPAPALHRRHVVGDVRLRAESRDRRPPPLRPPQRFPRARRLLPVRSIDGIDIE